MEEKQDTLLVVDDEADILKAIKRLFRKNYNVLTAQTTEQAREILDTNDVHVILCDQRLPKETGVAFFSQIRHNYPDIIRVLFTGYANVDSIIDAINEGAVYRYISKPWQPNELKIVIEQSFEQYHQRVERKTLIHQLKMANDELKSANEELTQIDDLRRVFMEVISHELNTPVAIVTGYSYLLKREIEQIDNPLMQKSISKIETSSLRLKRISERIFKMLHTNNPGTILKYSQFQLHTLLNALQMQVEPFLQKRNIQLIMEAEVTVETIEADFEKLLDALFHIVMNAIKFSEDGKTIQLKVTGDNDSEIVIEIEDNGLGIKEVDMPQIFKAFFSSFNTANHSSGEYEFGKRGIGLGLSLAKKFIEMHHGTIEATSTEGEGTTIKIILPRSREQ